MRFTCLGKVYSEFIGLPENERGALALKFHEENADYLKSALGGHDWIIVLGDSGRTYRSGRWNEFPDNEELERIGKETDEVPYIYHKPVLPPETCIT